MESRQQVAHYFLWLVFSLVLASFLFSRKVQAIESLSEETRLSVYIIIICALLLVALTFIAILRKKRFLHENIRLILWIVSNGLIVSAMWVVIACYHGVSIYFGSEKGISMPLVWAFIGILASGFGWLIPYCLFHPAPRLRLKFYPHSLVSSYRLFVIAGFILSYFLQGFMLGYWNLPVTLSINVCNGAICGILLYTALLFYWGKTIGAKKVVTLAIIAQILCPAFIIYLISSIGIFGGTLIVCFALGCILGLASYYAFD